MGSAELHLRVKESERIYSDMSVYGRTARETKETLLSHEDTDSTDENYESIIAATATGARRKRFTRKPKLSVFTAEKKPPLPEKNIPLRRMQTATDADIHEYYATPKKIDSLISSGYNEDDEEFEDVCHPDDVVHDL